MLLRSLPVRDLDGGHVGPDPGAPRRLGAWIPLDVGLW